MVWKERCVHYKNNFEWWFKILIVGITEVNLTRLEMSTLLCMADRQHSQLMDLMPEKSGMTGHGKELFEPTLKEVM